MCLTQAFSSSGPSCNQMRLVKDSALTADWPIGQVLEGQRLIKSVPWVGRVTGVGLWVGAQVISQSEDLRAHTAGDGGIRV